ncbi:hypothetical protein [Paracoccus ravus]|nr:hypothetical protein [Paracoccus ravus]
MWVADPELIERFAALGTEPVAAELATPAAMDKHIHAEIELWSGLLKTD